MDGDGCFCEDGWEGERKTCVCGMIGRLVGNWVGGRVGGWMGWWVDGLVGGWVDE